MCISVQTSPIFKSYFFNTDFFPLQCIHNFFLSLASFKIISNFIYLKAIYVVIPASPKFGLIWAFCDPRPIFLNLLTSLPTFWFWPYLRNYLTYIHAILTQHASHSVLQKKVNHLSMRNKYRLKFTKIPIFRFIKHFFTKDLFVRYRFLYIVLFQFTCLFFYPDLFWSRTYSMVCGVYIT